MLMSVSDILSMRHRSFAMISGDLSIVIGLASLALGAAGIYFTISGKAAIDEIRRQILKDHE
jgi:hypothetical protein